MKFSLSWIGEFVELTDSSAEIARFLTSAGLPVETVTSTPEGDTVLDLEVFPNRPDCMSVYGIARELAAATRRELRPYPAEISEADESAQASSLAGVDIGNSQLCGRYSARVMQGVTVAPSPDWLAGRLTTIGLRPVNNIVDATNYVLWEFGHPLHAFDYDTVKGHEIKVRQARQGERITTLDGVARTLEPEMLVIADLERAIAVAGVMGGAPTMVTGSTANLLLESAHFNPTSVRRTARKLGLSTDASYRFERGADIEATVVAVNRAAALIRKVAGGVVCPGVLDVRTAAAATRRLELRSTRVAMLLGIEIEPETIESALRALQFAVSRQGDLFDVAVPSHRQDIEREVDLIEEVARHIGYESVPERLPNIPGTGGVARAGHSRERALRRALETGGYSEAVTGSFVSSQADSALRPGHDADVTVEPVALTNPIAADLEILRTTLLPGLLGAVARNVHRGRRDLRLYEIGRVFRRGQTGQAEETVSIGLALTGNVRAPHWIEAPREASFHDMKGMVESILAEAGLHSTVESLPPLEGLDPARSALVVGHANDGQQLPVGRLGALARIARDHLDIRQDVFVAELSLGDICRLPEAIAVFTPLPRHPAVSRDLSLVVGTDRTYRELDEAIRAVAPDRIAGVTLFDRYRGGELPAGTVGLSVNIIYQHPDRTLASEEVMELQLRILESLKGRFGVRLRE